MKQTLNDAFKNKQYCAIALNLFRSTVEAMTTWQPLGFFYLMSSKARPLMLLSVQGSTQNFWRKMVSFKKKPPIFPFYRLMTSLVFNANS